jgi:hypothetical protein
MGILRGDDYGDYYGGHVSMSEDGTRIAVSGKNGDSVLLDAGYVSIYEKIGRAWKQLGESLHGKIANEHFGYSVALSGDGTTVAIGSPWNGASGTESGTVRVYKYTYDAPTAVWSWTAHGNELHGDQAYDRFGSCVTMNHDGSRFMGGSIHSDTRGINSGQVLPYEYTGGAWLIHGSALRGDGIGYKFGTSLEMDKSGDTVVIGSPYYKNSAGEMTGGAKVMQWTFQWSQKGSTLEGRHVDDKFGQSVAIDETGETVAIGAPGVSLGVRGVYTGDEANRGYVDIYSWKMTSTWEVYDWKLTGRLLGGVAEQEFFGYSVSMNSFGDFVAVGAPELTRDGEALVGGVSVFHRAQNTWAQHGDTIPGKRGNSHSGFSVVMSGDASSVVIGGPRPADGSFSAGSVSFYQVVTAQSGSSDLDLNEILGISNLCLLGVVFLFIIYTFFQNKKSIRRGQIDYETNDAIDENNKRENVNIMY